MLDLIRIVTVTYNSAAVIGRFLDSLPSDIEVIIVDNASTDNTVQIINARGVQVLQMDQNLGFGSACNRGAEGNTRPFVYFVNPDSIVNADGCECLVQTAQSIKKFGAMNPALLNEAGHIRLKRRSTLVPRAQWTPKALARDPNAHREVRILTGGALFCSQRAFDAVGRFDERIFLYHEDDDLCFRLRAAGYGLYIDHRAKITHIGGGSSGSSLEGSAFKSYQIAQSRMYVERKHGHAFPRLKAAGRALGKLLSPANLSRRKRAQTMGYLRGTLDFRMDTYGR